MTLKPEDQRLIACGALACACVALIALWPR
jgi:hypothetical protein